MRILIVDDEPLARRGVRARLNAHPALVVVGESADGATAVADIQALKPDLVFLDIHMPGMDGFEVIQAIPADELPHIIFLTAYDVHALRAFEVNAIDYLVKPPEQARFDAALRRALDLFALKEKSSEGERLLRVFGAASGRYLARVAIRTGTRIEVVNVSDIQWVASAGDYVELRGRGRTWLLRDSMNALEQRLDPGDFVRIHRTRIVRRSAITELRALENKEFVLKLSDGTTHRSSRTYASRLVQWLESERHP